MIKIFIAKLYAYKSVFRTSLALGIVFTVIALMNGATAADLAPAMEFYYLFSQGFCYFASFFLFLGCAQALYAYMRSAGLLQMKGAAAIDALDSFIQHYVTERLPAALAVFIAYLGISFFFIGKAFVKNWGGFYADPLLLQLETVLHFGQVPLAFIPDWMFQHRFIALVDEAYLSWFSVMYFFVGYALFAEKDMAQQKRFIWSSLILWFFAGVGAAMALSSCGPIFLEFFHTQLAPTYQPFVDKMIAIAREHKETYSFLKNRDLLYANTLKGDLLPQFSISAMPSLHVAIAWLNVLYARKINPWFAGATFAYFVVILFGSVFLLWHYAIDGYAGMILASLVWYGMGKIVKR